MMSTILLMLSLFTPVTNADSIVDPNDENVMALSKKEREIVLKSNTDLIEKIDNLESEGYEVEENKVYRYAEDRYFISFEKDNIKGLIELTENLSTVFYTELNSNLEIQKSPIEKSDGEIAIVEYDETGNPIVPN